jgi:hypothetical protein
MEKQKLTFQSDEDFLNNKAIVLDEQKRERYTFEELRAGALKNIPKCKGIYKVYMPCGFEMKFRNDSDAPFEKNKLKEKVVLQDKWEEICKYPGYEDGLLYIGNSKNLRNRLRQFLRTGYGDATNHYGGSSIFQLENNKQLQIQIIECENYEELKAQEIDAYINHRKEMPFANWVRGKKSK